MAGAPRTLDESWRTAGADTFNLQEKSGVTNPVLDASHVTDVADVLYIADPFLVKDGDTYYLFYEVQISGIENLAVISYSTSTDGLNWTYGSKIMDDTLTGATHLSYPMVFKVDNDWFMLPDHTSNQAKLYRATAFPTAWEYVDTLLDRAYEIRDSVIFQYDGAWYIYTWDKDSRWSKLFRSNYLYGEPYEEHPKTNMINGLDATRAGGRPIIRPGVGVDILIQDGDPVYGNAVRIFRLTNLTQLTLTFAELASSPLLEASGIPDWRETGMHQLDRIDSTLSIVDGHNDTVYSIGIYEDV